MPFNLLLLPLLGGYIIANFGALSKFTVLRSDGHRLLFASAAAGVMLLTLATIVRAFLLSTLALLHIAWPATCWHRVAPFDYSAIAFLSLLFAVPITFIINTMSDESRAVDRAIQRKSDPAQERSPRVAVASRIR
jgi:hypothetical protein